MNIHIQLAQFLEGLEEQRKAILSYLPVNGYKTTQELFSACAECNRDSTINGNRKATTLRFFVKENHRIVRWFKIG